MRLQNKVALVTAATRGIGLAIARACAKEGAMVFIGARNMELAETEAEKLRKENCTAMAVYNDATLPETYDSMVNEVVKTAGRIDVLVNNFGTSDTKKDLNIEHTNAEDFLDIISKNLRSVFLSSQKVIPHMAASGGGSIINISSVGGLVPDISQIAYGTSKAAINYLTKLIALQEAKHNIRCNAILPGMTATESVKQHLSDEFKEFFLRHIPAHRMGTSEEIAAAAVYFASDESAYATGQILTLSGGFGLGTPLYADYLLKSDKR